MNSILTDDQYGDLGIERDPCWSDQWSRFDPSTQENHFKVAAHWGPLTRSQVKDLIQGLPPAPCEYLDLHTHLQQAHGPLTRLEEAIAHKVLSAAPTPIELVRWCEANAIELPESFVLETLELQPKPAQPTKGPSWAPVPSCPTTPEHIPKGRPKTMEPVYDAILDIATKYLMSEAREGRYVGVKKIAQHIHALPIGQGMQTSSIERRLKSRLPLPQAKQIAGRVSAKKSGHSCP